MTERRPDLSDPDYARFAWGRYRRLMIWMAFAAFSATAIALGILEWTRGPLPLLFLALTAGGIFLSVMLAAALMGLVFLSSGTGHDASIQDFSEDKNDDRFA
jgi:preprotein translocase subunit SecG